MSDSDNYFSDSDKSEKEEENKSSDIENSEEISDDEMDDETRQIIYSSLMKKKNDNTELFSTLNDIVPKKKNKNKQRKVKNIGLSLLEFEKKIEDSKPKRWKSKRFEDKKNDLGIVDKKVYKKRHFNPRLPPPTYKTFKKENDKDDLNTDSDEAFPSLSDTYKDVIV